MDQFMLLKSRLLGRPYCASFELTPLCNFDCKMCYSHLTMDQMRAAGRMLTTEEWIDIMRQAVDAGVTCIDLTGGECLTHPGFKEIYRYLVMQGVHVSVLTNGQLIDEELINLFVQYPPACVQITVYGSNREAYLNVTGRDAFQDVMSAITRLKEAGLRVSISITPNRFMQRDVGALLELVRSLGIVYRIGSTTLPARPETGRIIDDFIVDNEVLREIRKLEAEYKSEWARVLPQHQMKEYKFRIKGQQAFEGIPCAAGAANFHINWKGDMMPCLAFYSVNTSVLKSGVEEAWQWIRAKMRTYMLPDECNNCELAGVCNGCPSERVAGVLNGPLNHWVCKRTCELKDSSFQDKECLL